MINLVQGKTFKGQDFEQPLGRLNLVIGKNGSGKSSRAMAVELLANGYLMGIGKRNADIFDACAKEGDHKIFVGCTVEFEGKKTKFLRRYARSEETGAVGLVLHVRDTKASAAQYAAAWASSQAPRLIDPDVFLGLSPAKQIEELFSLFPPEGDLSGLSFHVETAKEKVNALRKNKIEQESLVGTLRQSIANLELGTGSHADVEAEEIETSRALDKAKTDLAAYEHAEQIRALNEQAAAEAKAKEARESARYEEMVRKGKEAQDKANAEFQARIDAERDIEAQKFRDQAELLKQAKAREAARLEKEAETKRILTEREHAVMAAEARLLKLAARSGLVIPEPVKEVTPPPQAGSNPGVEAIEKIISAIERAGCDTCAALMVAKREKRNLQGGAT